MDNVWTVEKILWNAKRNKPCSKFCYFHHGLVCFYSMLSANNFVAKTLVYFPGYSVYLRSFIQKFWISYLALNELSFKKNHESISSFKKFSELSVA